MASAFAPAPQKATSTAMDAALSKDTILSEPDTTEFGKIWDPLGLAEGGSDETIAWYRHSEIKHGRVAMAAFVGMISQAAGVRFPGELAHGLNFADVPGGMFEAWDAVPGWGKAQMLLFAGLVELHDEIFFSRRGTHYMKGGTPGKNMVPGLFDPFGMSTGKSAEAKAKGRSSEIKNGRLAMIGMAGMWAATTLEGSVPLQPPC